MKRILSILAIIAYVLPLWAQEDVKTLAIIETNIDPACNCNTLYETFHSHVWTSETDDIQTYDTPVKYYYYKFLKKTDGLNDFFESNNISHYVLNEIKKEPQSTKVNITSTLYTSSGRDVHQVSFTISQPSEAYKAALQLNKEMDFFKDRGRIMETILVENFEAKDELRDLDYHLKIPKWVYNELNNKPLIKKVAKLKRVEESNEGVSSYIDGEISEYPHNSELVKIDLIVYIREKKITGSDEKTFTMDGGNQRIGSESKEYWGELVKSIYNELMKK